ncbi:MAG: hypothetical protein A2381_13635 [Bdellovibrionales bacterium RIFOXYB1_FULL_37_110]|nr:MAG: hypothetical protein A2417_05270 [Bdellovibrionales bacterium RIFOXYC1_FULL_37_79]OFZ56903.1 MAG: hypothetical protein A2381_13635 [Bdellovibrionales bacterium RIFOXYB1_FULL_37_110]OFZ61990.1 MAG: hypothetical protein A2577_19105 [Bdellovibrionales bacterium RIFOXYD1_FULL_36_51]
MRKLFVITLGMLLAVPAIADVMPTIYGKVNREVQMRDLDSENAATKDLKNIRANDVANSESRIGVKGEYQFNDHTAKYVLELGLNSGTNTIGIRESYVDIGGFWGSIITGQTYAAGDMVGLKLDPLSGTSAGLEAVDIQKTLVDSYDIASDHALGAYGIGYTYRSRQELIGYRTPNFAGFQYYTTIDNDDSVALAGNTMTVWSNQASFEKEMNGMNLGVYAAYDVLSSGGLKDASVMGFGASFGMMGFGLTGMYTKSEAIYTDADLAMPKPLETTQMMVTGKYTFMDTNTVAVTYGKMSNEDKNVTGNAAKNNQSQIAAAFIKELHKNVSVRASYGIVEKEQEDTTLNTDTIANGGGFKATVAAVGTTITF